MSGDPDPKPLRGPRPPRKRLAARRPPAAPKDVTEALRDAQARFRRVVLGLDGGCVCAGLGECDPVLQAHHAVSQQRLRKRGLEAEVWSPDDGVTLCYRHHRRHDLAIERVPLDRLPERCLRFAATHDLLDVLERTYPSGPAGTLPA